MHLFSLTSPKNIAQSSPELVTFSLPPSFICLRNPIISICVKPRAWSLKQRRANLIWVNSGALCRWIKHRFSLMLPGLIKSQIPPLSSMVTQCRSPCARGDRKDEAPAAYLQLWLRGKITAEDTQVYATYTDMMEIAFWSRFFLMNNTLGERNEEWMKARERERENECWSPISSHLSCHANPFNCAQIGYV